MLKTPAIAQMKSPGDLTLLPEQRKREIASAIYDFQKARSNLREGRFGSDESFLEMMEPRLFSKEAEDFMIQISKV